MADFASLDEVEAELGRLSQDPDPLVRAELAAAGAPPS